MINKKTKNKKALSTVVATVVIILLTVAAIAIVWTFVKGMVERNRDQVESCFNVEAGQKVALNGLYTCYEDTDADNDLDEVQFSLNLADVEVEAVIISIMAGGSTKTVTLTNDLTSYPDIGPYNGNNPVVFGDPVRLPDKNSGLTYVVNGFPGGINEVDWIKIAPIVNGNQCGVTDQINDVSNCAFLTG